ncbi:MAG: sulfite exporter TauE/SafE family protein [Bacteroidota bacterium]
MNIIAALTLGLMGSLHCIGMCGPIAMALPHSSESKWTTLSNLLLYNGGRVVTYGFIGILFGAIGLGVSLAGYQQALSIILGVTLLAVALFSLNLEKSFVQWPLINKLFFWVKNQLSQRLQHSGSSSFFVVGLLNGLLPCGMVYMALAGAVLAGSIIGGAIFMMVFGLGTIPLMLLASLAKGMVSPKVRKRFMKLVPAFMAIIAMMLIFRGISPAFVTGGCH